MYLGDNTFGQFCDGATVRSPDVDSGVPVSDPLVREIIANGFMELTDESLRQYLRATSCEGPVGRSYIDTATVVGMLAVAHLASELNETDAAIRSGEIYHVSRADSCAGAGCDRVLPGPLPALR